MKKHNKRFVVINYLISTVISNKPLVLINYFISFLLNFVTIFRTVILPKTILEEILYIYNNDSNDEHLYKIFLYVLLIVGIYLLTDIINNYIDNYKVKTGEWFTNYFRKSILDKTFCIDYSKFESAEISGQIGRAREGINKYYGENIYGILDNIFRIINNSVSLVIISAILINIHPILVLLHIIFVLIKSVFINQIKKLEISQFQKKAESNRLFAYLFFEITDYSYGKDIRLYNSSNFFNEKAQYHLDFQKNTWQETSKGKCLANNKIICLDVIDTILSYIFLSLKAISKEISIGDFTMGISSSIIFFQSSQNIALAIQEIMKKDKYIMEYINFISLPNSKDNGNRNINTQNPHCFEFKNVYFKYENDRNYILENISFKINNGEKIAIVGLNGSGKTTIIKLLCRLYMPTKGEILLDGFSINQYDEESYRNIISVIFQDFNLFAFSIEENIILTSPYDEKKFIDITNKANFTDDFLKLPNGQKTSLSSLFESNGIELSGGQKQKIAFARALYKEVSLLILDEPTSSMDPISEAQLYKNFNSISENRTTIFISHRLASCKFCDKIIVLNNKHIIDIGTHTELMNRNNLYSKLYISQKKSFNT